MGTALVAFRTGAKVQNVLLVSFVMVKWTSHGPPLQVSLIKAAFHLHVFHT